MSDRFAGPWFDAKTAAAYICATSMKGFYNWCYRKHIVRAGRLIAKADLDRAIKAKPRPRRMATASLANLQRPAGPLRVADSESVADGGAARSTA